MVISKILLFKTFPSYSKVTLFFQRNDRKIMSIVKIIIKNAANKPIVQIAEPTPEELIPFDKKLYVRGFATDDDSVKSVKIQLDDNEAIIQETRGDFYYELCSGADLSMGNC